MSEWIKWEGKGEAPTGMVFVRLRDGDESKEPYNSGKFYWDHDNSPSDIAAYKLATSAVDMVNNPPHYKQGAVECIDAIRAALTEQAEVHARELRAYEATVASLEARIQAFESALEYTDKEPDQCAS